MPFSSVHVFELIFVKISYKHPKMMKALQFTVLCLYAFVPYRTVTFWMFNSVLPCLVPATPV
jgi:hypothetical protein